MKIETTFCDLHPTVRLVRGTVKLNGQYEARKTLCCTKAGCTRQFHYDYGYFDFVSGEDTDLGDLKTKPKCGQKHDMIYMLLTKIDGLNVYACFNPECPNTLPYPA